MAPPSSFSPSPWQGEGRGGGRARREERERTLRRRRRRLELREGGCYHAPRRSPPVRGACRRGLVIKSAKAQIVFAWGFVGVAWLACGLHVFSRYPEVPVDSLAGLRFFTVDTVLAVFALGGAHYVLQLGLMKVLDRIDIDPGNKSSMMRLNRAGLLMIFLEVVVIYQAAHYTFRTFVL